MAREKKYPKQSTIRFKNDVDQRIIDFVNKQSNFSDAVLYFIEKEIAANGIRNLQEYIPGVRNILEPLEEEQQPRGLEQAQEEKQPRGLEQAQEEKQPRELEQAQEEKQPRELEQAQEEKQPRELEQVVEIPLSYTDF